MKKHHKHKLKHNQSQSSNQTNPVTMDYKMTIHLTPQTPEIDRHASDAENEATWEQNAEKEYFAITAEAITNDTKACRKQHNNIPSPTHSQIATGYHPTATPPH